MRLCYFLLIPPTHSYRLCLQRTLAYARTSGLVINVGGAGLWDLIWHIPKLLTVTLNLNSGFSIALGGRPSWLRKFGSTFSNVKVDETKGAYKITSNYFDIHTVKELIHNRFQTFRISYGAADNYLCRLIFAKCWTYSDCTVHIFCFFSWLPFFDGEIKLYIIQFIHSALKTESQ